MNDDAANLPLPPCPVIPPPPQLKSYYLYSLADGLLNGVRLDCFEDLLAQNIPVDQAAIEGVTDWQSQRIDLTTGELVDYQPPAPLDDDLRTWAWNTETKRWVSSPTLAANKATRIAPVQREIERLEATQARPVRELLTATLANQTPSEIIRQRLQDIANAIASLQAVRASMQAASSQADLDAIAWPNQ
jgi:hypothetical protein